MGNWGSWHNQGKAIDLRSSGSAAAQAALDRYLEHTNASIGRTLQHFTNERLEKSELMGNVIGMVHPDELGGSPMAKAIRGAYSYHPYSGPLLMWMDYGWLIGPAFAVKVNPELQAFLTLADAGFEQGKMFTPQDWYGMVKLSAVAEGCTEGLGVDQKGHSKAQEQRRGKFGEVIGSGATKCTCRALRPSQGQVLLELPFPFYRLLKHVGATHLQGYPPDYVERSVDAWRGNLFGLNAPTFPAQAFNLVCMYDGEELVGLLSAKIMEEACRPNITL